MRVQFNTRISKASLKRVAFDRRNTPTTNDVIVEVALEDFFTRHTPEQRAGFYRAHDRKPYARGR